MRKRPAQFWFYLGFALAPTLAAGVVWAAIGSGRLQFVGAAPRYWRFGFETAAVVACGPAGPKAVGSVSVFQAGPVVISLN